MSFRTSIADWVRGLDASGVSYKLEEQTGNTALSLPASGKFWPGNPRSGMVRVKSSSVGSGGQVKLGAITATDGTNIATVYRGDRRYSDANQAVDASFRFNFDWQVKVMNLNIWTFGAASTFDVELVGTE